MKSANNKSANNSANNTTVNAPIKADEPIQKTIYKSYDYSKFNYLPSNRLGDMGDINNYPVRLVNRFKKRLKAIMDSIEENGFDTARCVLVGELITGKYSQLFILDGQGRKEATRLLTEKDPTNPQPYYYQIVPRQFHSIEEMDKYVLSLNTTQTNWTEEEKIAAFLKNANNRAQFPTLVNELEILSEEFGLSYAQVFRMLYSNASINKVFVDGKMGNLSAIRNKDMLIELMRYFRENGVSFWKNNKFISALTSTISQHYFNDACVGRMKADCAKMYKCTQPTEYRVMFAKVFDFAYISSK